jgi:2-methylaconitate cis-trans-isomerase PrpF
MQRRIPCVIMRGGTSRGPVFLRSDLPDGDAEMDRVLLAAMGSPHPLQVDGIGGGHPLTSKAAIVGPSADPEADVDYLFVQVSVNEARADRSANCGNMLSAVAPFAVEQGLVSAGSPETVVRVRNVNTGIVVKATVSTPDRQVTYEGDTRIDGVGGSGAPIFLDFGAAVGLATGSLLPTGSPVDRLGDLEASLIDGAVPLMILRAADLGIGPEHGPEAIDANAALLQRIETARLEAGRRMGLGDVAGSVVPKVALVGPSDTGADLRAWYFTPRQCHRSMAITGAITLATARFAAGSIVDQVARRPDDGRRVVTIQHPSGRMEVAVTLDPSNTGYGQVASAALVRTARRLFEGCVIVAEPVAARATVAA